MIDPAWIGHRFEPLVVEVEAGRIRQFARAIGETRPEHVDVAAAREQGWPSLPVPPTMLFALEMEQPNPWIYMETIGMDLAEVLHGGQRFEYHQMAFAGDTLTFHVAIVDVVAKKGGALEMVTKATRVENQRGEHVADLGTVLVVRHAEAAA